MIRDRHHTDCVALRLGTMVQAWFKDSLGANDQTADK